MSMLKTALGKVATALRPPAADAPGEVAVADRLLPLGAAPIEIETEADAEGLAQLMAHTEKTWTRLGDEEPHWSVLSAERFKQDQLEEGHLNEFFASGQGDVQIFLAFLARNGVDANSFQRVLEYGCGLGRVTRFLAQRFPQVVACDISPSHLEGARQHLQRSGLNNVELLRIRSLHGIDGPADLDAIFSVIVLQHNPPPAIVAILQRLLARLRSGGVAYFQVPTHAVGYRFGLADYLKHGLGAKHIEMHYVPQRRIFQIARDSGCDVLEVREDNWVGRRDVEMSNTFLLRKR
jgi:SAM-dependent methyltransferase